MEIVYTLENSINGKNEKSIFLAGPTYREKELKQYSWRIEAIALIEKEGFDGTVYVPDFRDGIQPEEWTFSRQVDWEVKNLESSTVILFWIPRHLYKLPAFTTNIEFGQFLN